MSPDTVSRCIGCDTYIMTPQKWCHECIKRTLTVQASIDCYRANGWNMLDALRMTLLDAYDAGRKRGTAADHRFPQ